MKKYYEDNAERFFLMVSSELSKVEPDMKNTLCIPEIVGHLNFRMGLKFPYDAESLNLLVKRAVEEIQVIYNRYYLLGVGERAFLLMVSRIDLTP